MVFLKYTAKSLVSRSFSFFLHRNQSLTSILLRLLPASAWTVLILAVRVGRELHSWNQIFQAQQKIYLFFLGVKLSLPGHRDPFTVFLFWLAVLHLGHRFHHSPFSLCVRPAGLSHVADDVHGGNLPCIQVGAHKQIRVYTHGCSYASNRNTTWQLSSDSTETIGSCRQNK